MKDKKKKRLETSSKSARRNRTDEQTNWSSHPEKRIILVPAQEDNWGFHYNPSRRNAFRGEIPSPLGNA